jgi:hypothetical protein
MNVFHVVVWQLAETKSGAMKRSGPVLLEGRALREVVATSSGKAKLKVVAAMAGEFDPETMEVEVADPFDE